MAQDTVNILRVDTKEAVKSINDLKENIKSLKSSLGDLEIGTEEYQDTLDRLKINQNALRDAMYATSASLEQVADAAKGANIKWDANNKLIDKGNISYNELVHTMAALKEEWRSTADEVRRAELGERIAQTNQKLKDMDASVGNFQRNVGNYSSALDGLKEGFLATAGGAGAVINPIKNVTMGFKTLSATPVIAILGLLANILTKVINNLDASEKNTNKMTLALAPLKAGTTALTKVFQFLGDKLADVATWLTNILSKLGFIDEAMQEHKAIAEEEIALTERRREVEKANADAQLEVAKLRAQAAEKDKYTAAERLKFIEDAAKKEREIADRNIEIARREYEVLERKSELADNSKEENDALAEAYVRLQNAETDYFNKTRELSAQRVEAINQIKAETEANQSLLESKEDLKAFEDEYEGFVEDDPWAEYEEQQRREAANKEATEALLNELLEEQRLKDEARQWELEQEQAFTAALEAEQQKRIDDRQAEVRAAIDNSLMLATATSGVLASIADMYEADEKNAVKNAKKIKALRIAEATINTISGAIGAFMQSVSSIPPPLGQIIGAANAAAVTAAGMVQIGQLRNTSVTGSSGSASGIGEMSINAPNVDTELQSVRNITSASEEERLNRMAQSQRVYILQSDIEAAGNQSRAQVAESSF